MGTLDTRLDPMMKHANIASDPVTYIGSQQQYHRFGGRAPGGTQGVK